MQKLRKVGVLLFEGFETLDVMGPIELFGMHPEAFSVHLVAGVVGPVASIHGHRVLAEMDLENSEDFDIVLVPGGQGTRQVVQDAAILAWIRRMEARVEILCSVCTGSALLARAGVLDFRRATSNKLSFPWVKTQSDRTHWVNEARWVEDGRIFTSSGVSAGMDMTLAVIQRLMGEAAAEDAALRAEYSWHRDSTRDPFAVSWGLSTPQPA